MLAMTEITPAPPMAISGSVTLSSPEITGGRLHILHVSTAGSVDLIRRAREPDARITYASGGVGSPQHLATEMFKSFAKVDLTHVPYRGASQATLAVASGEVDLMSMALSLAQPFLQDGKVRLIGYCGPQRHAQFRDIPTLQEQGVKGYDYSSWIGLFFHKDVPAEVSIARVAPIRSSLRSNDCRSR